MIVRVSVVLKGTVGDSDWRFDNLNGSHLQSQSDILSSVDGIYTLYSINSTTGKSMVLLSNSFYLNGHTFAETRNESVPA